MGDAPSVVLPSEIEAARHEDGGNDDSGFDGSGSEISSTILLENRSGVLPVLAVTSGDENLPHNVRRQESEDYGFSSLEGGPNVEGLSLVSDASHLSGDNVLGFEPNSESGTPLIDVETSTSDVELISNTTTSGDISAGVTIVEDIVDGLSSRSSPDVVPIDTVLNGRASRSIFEVSYVPLWGFTSVCGRTPDMEDAVSIIPQFVEIPLQMFVDRPPDGLNSRVTHLMGHFFGVFDGHGGSEVANYCKDRFHSALAEELDVINTDLKDGNRNESREDLWTRALTKCFLKVDGEVGGEGRLQPVARENVGSTAIIALVFTSHIIVANCGDSRAVLCRGREPIALSVDQKPDREDELARIEAAGGRVISWNGYRVSGMLAMSRSIGDRYLKPPVIPDPEVMIVPRAKDDECLILASDGLWDVMSNEEVCDVARRCIQLWYRNNAAATLPSERGEDVDPASQAAAEALTRLALQKGSEDNISVIILDLKRQRKSRNRS